MGIAINPLTIELAEQLAPYLEKAAIAVYDAIKGARAAGHDSKAPLPPEHQAAAAAALAPVAAIIQPAAAPETDTAQGFIDKFGQ